MPLLENSAPPLVAIDHPVIHAAVDWMEAALAIGEATGDLPQTTPYAKAGVASAQAALAG
jgi:hypothetical protein